METSGKKLLGAMVAAAAVGATLGVLFAPGKGKDTRKKINRKADELKDKFNDLVEELKCEYQDIREKVKDFADAGKS